jgi:hypothetical protein
MSIEKAFYAVCENAKPARASYVSLYRREPFFGGPEEGGWWSHDDKLVAYHRCSNDVDAEAIEAEVDKLAERMTKEAQQSFNEACFAECLEAERRNVDVDDLYPEVDGPVRYWVATEERPGELASEGNRHYE